MPKMKTKSSAKKRFKVTGTGKIKRKHAFKSHILTKKSKKRKLAFIFSTKESGHWIPLKTQFLKDAETQETITLSTMTGISKMLLILHTKAKHLVI